MRRAIVWAAGVSEGSTARTVAIGLTGAAPSFSLVTSEPLLCAISLGPADSPRRDNGNRKTIFRDKSAVTGTGDASE
ncbi:hypothetical protein Mame01_50320 [Microbispora amethystogenes]|nr:hypothetical protein Mame01_50320 [Microbispora amethystogenes]